LTTPEPVSPAPDTDTDRYRIAYALNEAVGEQLDGGEGMAAAADAVLPIVNERVAGLRADLDQARRELAEIRAEAGHHIGTIAALAARVRELGAQVAARDAELARVSGARSMTTPNDLLPLLARLLADLDRVETERDKLCREVDRLHAELAGARPIPDDAAERLARWLFRMTGRRQGEPLYGDGAASPERQEKRWNTWLEDEDRDRLREMARHVLADLGLSTPTTGPAPAAADGPRPKRSEWLCPDCKQPPTPFGDDRDWMCDEHKSSPPAAPQAPAEPTGRVWNVGDPEPTEDGLTVIDRDMTPDVIGRYNDPTWFREGPDRWSGPYAYRLTWAGLLKEHGPVREYRHPAAREDAATPDPGADYDAQLRWADGPDGDDLGGWARRSKEA